MPTATQRAEQRIGTERDAERAHARMMLQRLIPSRQTLIYTRTEYTRGSTDYVSVYVVKGREIHDITYYVAAAVPGRKMRQTDRGIGLRGGQYSKALEVADLAWRTRFDGASIPQGTNWRELR
jgi:hypothetical protein